MSFAHGLSIMSSTFSVGFIVQDRMGLFLGINFLSGIVLTVFSIGFDTYYYMITLTIAYFVCCRSGLLDQLCELICVVLRMSSLNMN